MKIIHGYSYFSLKRKISLLLDALKEDAGVVFTTRFQRVLLNSFIKR